jgi:hypothetical protein
MNDGEASFVSDRDKGLKESIYSEFPEALNLSCTQHLAENVCSKFGRGVAGLFRKLAKTFSKLYFEQVLNEIQSIKPEAKAYIDSIPRESYANAYVRIPRYGHTTSNVVESCNSFLKQSREQPVINVVDQIISWQIGKRVDRLSREQSGTLPFVARIYQDIRKLSALSRNYQVLVVDDFRARVTVLEHNRHYMVNLVEQSCTCGEFFDFQFPCAHAVSFCNQAAVDPFLYVNEDIYSRESYVACYSTVIFPTAPGLSALPDQVVTNPPAFAKSKGRPRKQRLKKTRFPAEKTYYCGNCGKAGHNKARCSKW